MTLFTSLRRLLRRRPTGFWGTVHEGAEEIAAALGDDCDVIHSHYWISGRAGAEVSRRLDVPHVTTFHTIAAVKEQAFGGGGEPAVRHEAEREIARVRRRDRGVDVF